LPEVAVVAAVPVVEAHMEQLVAQAAVMDLEVLQAPVDLHLTEHQD
jgi:hypothetical protein